MPFNVYKLSTSFLGHWKCPALHPPTKSAGTNFWANAEPPIDAADGRRRRPTYRVPLRACSLPPMSIVRVPFAAAVGAFNFCHFHCCRRVPPGHHAHQQKGAATKLELIRISLCRIPSNRSAPYTISHICSNRRADPYIPYSYSL